MLLVYNHIIHSNKHFLDLSFNFLSFNYHQLSHLILFLKLYEVGTNIITVFEEEHKGLKSLRNFPKVTCTAVRKEGIWVVFLKLLLWGGEGLTRY